jgi:hypothetical protein
VEQDTGEDKKEATMESVTEEVTEDARSTAGLVVLLMPMLAEQRVLVLGDSAPWLVSGAAALESVPADEPILPVADGAFDIVIVPERWRLGPEESTVLLDEVRRALAPRGFAVVRLGQGEEAAELESALAERFPSLAQVAETPFVGMFYAVGDGEEMAIAGNLARLGAGRGPRIAFCGAGPEPGWSLPESLFIPVEGYEALVAAGERAGDLEVEVEWLRRAQAEGGPRLAALSLEVDELREALLTRQDRSAESEATLGAIRRETGRHLALIATQADKLEQLGRDQAAAERRALAAEQALAEAEVALRRRAMEIAALERELDRLRGKAAATPAVTTTVRP